MTELEYSCGCKIDFIAYGVTEVDLCPGHEEEFDRIEREEKEATLV
jgi:hypothetical protein